MAKRRLTPTPDIAPLVRSAALAVGVALTTGCSGPQREPAPMPAPQEEPAEVVTTEEVDPLVVSPELGSEVADVAPEVAPPEPVATQMVDDFNEAPIETPDRRCAILDTPPTMRTRARVQNGPGPTAPMVNHVGQEWEMRRRIAVICGREEEERQAQREAR